MATSYADVHFTTNFSDSSTISMNHSMNSLDMVVVCYVEGRPGLGTSLTDILPSLKHLSHS